MSLQLSEIQDVREWMDCRCYCSHLQGDVQGLDQIYLIYYYAMKKLLQLLNEYQTQRGSKFKFSGYDERSQSFLLVDSNEVLWEETIISKKFWFIQWLVDNDKIDIQWAKNLLYESEIFNPLPYTDLAERLIMCLAIQDDPINFLVSILK